MSAIRLKTFPHACLATLVGAWLMVLLRSDHAATIPLTSFEDVAFVQPLGNSVCSQARQHVTDGTHSLKVDFSNSEYPNVVFPASMFATDDWSQAGALVFDAFNADRAPMALIIRCRDASGNSCDARVNLPPGLQQRVAVVLHLPNQVKMKGYPLKQACDADQCGSYGLDFIAKPVASLEFFLDHPGRAQTAYFDHFRLEAVKRLTKFVDQYGQTSLQEDWAGKIHNDQDLKSGHRREAAELSAGMEALKGATNLDAYGGWATGPQLQAGGWFRTEKRAGKWWLVTPSGHLFWSTGIDCVSPVCANVPGNGNLDLFSWLPPAGDPLCAYSWSWGVDFYQMNLFRTYGQDWPAPWRKSTGDRMTAWGFNTLGAWAGDKEYAELKKPFTVDLSGGNMDTIKKAVPDSYSRIWATNLESLIEEQTRAWKDNPLCIGYFVGNEMPWPERGELPVEALKLPGSRAVKAAFATILKTQYSAIEKLNQAWAIATPAWTDWTEFQANPVVLPAQRNARLKLTSAGSTPRLPTSIIPP